MAIKKTIKNERYQVIHPITEVSAVEGLSEALAQKQDLLNSGVNIKTINGESILGPGNMIIDGGGSTISVDTEMSDTSENPVQNKVITQAISGFITKSVDDLVNYYLKSETYNKTEVDSLIAAVNQFTYEVAASLPTASASTMYKIYLIPSSRPETQNVKDEYITIRSGSEGSYTYSWEQIGSTAIDLSDYVTTSALNTALADYTTTAQLNTLLAAKQDVINDLSTIRSGAAAGATAYQKPSGGIPKSDLNSGVQASLDLADSAVQADPVGSVTPPVTPSDWATAEQVEELEAKVDGISSVDYTVTKGQQYGGNGYLSWNRYCCSGQIPSGTYNFKCPTGFYYSVFKYVSDAEGVAVFSYNTTDRNNAYIDGPWIISVKKVDGTELSTVDIDTINSAGIVTKVTGDNIDTMRVKIHDLEAEIVPVEEFVNGNKSGNFLCLGDNLTFGVGVINSQTPVESANTYPKQMEKILGGKSYNGGVGGSSMTDNGSADFPIVVDALTSGDYTELNTKLDSLTGVNTLAKTRWLEIESLNIASLDFIAIAFGVNDWTIGAGITAVCDALQTGINKLRQAFPGVKLYVFTPTFAYLLGYGMAFNTDNYTSYGLYLDEYCDAIEQLCNELNVPVKNMYYCSGIKSGNAASFYTDGKHRNANGYKLLAKQYAGLIRNN